MDLSDAHPTCPEHDAYMVPYAFQVWELSLAQGTVSGFRCPNLICPIVYVTGALAGFYTLEPNGDLTPYSPER
jgi:hypothetical protein